MSKVHVITLYEGDYHYGVAALINSLITCGFQGTLTVHYKDKLPPWIHDLNRVGECLFQLPNCMLAFKRTAIKRHFGYHKPFVALEEMLANPDCETVVYADPDILFLAPWTFFEEWFSMGLAICLDSHYAYVSENHPWRRTWKDLLARGTGKDESNPISWYANSGFAGINRSDIDFLRLWMGVTETFEEEGGNTTFFDTANRCAPIITDQDLFAAALMGWQGPVSLLGEEGMGFKGYPFILSHNIGAPKAWQRGFIREALKGTPPSPAEGLYLKFSNSHVAAYSPQRLFTKRLAFKFAQLISRFWSR